MSNLDSLLDFGDDPAFSPTHGPSSGSVTGSTPDPFDPFGPSVDQTGAACTYTDDFDPFGGPPTAETMSADMDVHANGVADKDADYDAQFADLLGDFEGDSGTITTTSTTTTTVEKKGGSSDSIQNGDVNSIISTSSTTTRETMENGNSIVEVTDIHTMDTSSQDPAQGQRDDPSQDTGYAGGDDNAPTFTARGSTSSQRTSTSSFEDSLPTYQPPKRYEKKEEKSGYKGPSVFITDSNEMAATSANHVMANGPELANQNGPSDLSANEEAGEVMKPSQPFGSLLAVWKTETDLGAGSDNMCKMCNKRVYEMEKMIADKAIYHKTCFKCCHCKRILSLGNFASMDGQPYCKPHFIELFKTKGKYDGMSGQAGKPITLASQQEAPPGGHDGYQEAPGNETEDLPNSYGDVSGDGQMNGAAHYDDDEPQQRDDMLREVPGEKDDFQFTQLHSVRNYFESASQTVDKPAPSPVSRTATARPTTTPSRWDKPRDDAPPPVNRHDDDEVPDANLEEELPPVAMTRNLVEKFRGISETTDYSSHRKPIHKITPPQEVLREGIEQARALEAQRDPNIIRAGDASPDDLPPPAITKNVAAKFRSMENDTLPSPSPSKSVTKKSEPSYAPERPRNSTNRASPDSGIVDVDSRYAGTNESLGQAVSDHEDLEVVREADRNDEKELPEQGITRNLLARWRDIEQQTDFKAPVMADHRAPSRTYSGSKASSSAPSQQEVRQEVRQEEPQAYAAEPQEELAYDDQYDGQSADREVARETDNNEEEFMPPAAFTRNMLEKFRNLEAEAEAMKHAPAPAVNTRKQFKWAVKEAPPMNRAGMSWQEAQRSNASDSLDDNRFDEEGHYINSHHDDREEEHQYDNQHQQEEEYYENEGQQIYDNIDKQRYDDDDDGPNESMRELDREDEIPPAAITKNLLAKFKSLEDVSKPPPTPQMANEAQRASRGSMALTSRQVHYVNDESRGVHMNGEREQYEEEENMYENIPADHHHGDMGDDRHNHDQHDEFEGGEYANGPVHNPDVTREADHNGEEELPEHGITRNLLAKFQSLQAH